MSVPPPTAPLRAQRAHAMLQPGEIIEGKYRIVRMLGQGGMGAVYEGENTRIHRRVAIKVLHAAVAAKADVVQRFEREAQAAGRIGSEHIVEVLDLGNLPSGERYMVMEFLEGDSLGERIKSRRRLPCADVAPIIHQLLEGLAAAHQAGIIHRDLKPDNVYLLASRGGKRDFVKVLDFGVSKFSALDGDSMSMTKTGAVMGTPYYMSPEQARGSKIDARSDLYSVGVVMYQSVTGRVPFSAETFNELVFKIALESPEPAELVVRDLDPAFASIIARAMIRDVNMRFQNAREFQTAVAQWMATGAHAPPGAPQYHAGLPGLGGVNPHPQQPSYPNFPGYAPVATTPQGGVRPADASGPHAAYGGVPMTTPHNTPGQGMQYGATPPGMGSGPYGQMSQSSPLLGASQAGMALTAPRPRSSGAMIALGLAGTLVVAGAAFGVYKIVNGRAAAAPPPPTASTTVPEPPPSAPSAEPTATTAASSEPSADASASAAPSSAPSAEPVARPKLGPLTPPPKKTAAPATGAATTPPPKTTGRVIGGDL
jgi:eukaryotic-like serine/threonine-protein kinase